MDIDRMVWETVRNRPDRKGLDVGLIPDRIGVSDRATVMAAVDRLVTEGRLYWRNPRLRRRLLHMPDANAPTVDVPMARLW